MAEKISLAELKKKFEKRLLIKKKVPTSYTVPSIMNQKSKNKHF